MDRQFNKGEKPHFVYSQFNGPNKYNKYFYVRMGVIEEIDYEKYELTVRWGDNSGVINKIPISFAYASPAGCLGALPEKGSVGVFGYFNEGGGKGSPYLLTYLSAGLNAALNFNDVKIYPDSLSTDDINIISYKHRKLLPGDMVMLSSLGASVFLNKSAEIRDSMGDKIFIREDDQSIISTSVNNFLFADGVAVYSGPALRNGLPVYDPVTGNKFDNNGSLMSFANKDNIYIVPHGKNIQYGTQFYTEYRVDADEFGDYKLDYNDINSSSPNSTRDPLVTFVLGNYIGADRKNPQTYGHNLKVRLFQSVTDKKGGLVLERANQKNGVDEPSTTGLAYALHFLKSKCFLGIDKEGHYYMNLPASSSVNKLGAGRSMSTVGVGNLKEIWGADFKNKNAWDLTTKGGISWDVGNHNENNKSRSIQITTSKGYYLEVKGTDDDGYGKRELIQGTVSEVTTGDKETTCGSLKLTINGLKTESISSGASESIQGDKSVNVLGVYSEIVAKEKQCKFGTRKTLITTGNDELTLIAGNISETVQTFGKKSTTVTSGSIEQSVPVAGKFSTSVKAGTYTVDVGAGAITIKTKVGLVTVSGTSVTIKGNILVNIDAPLVRVGKGALIGGTVSGLPGKPTHFDYVTGLPLMGSLKVSVG